MNGGWGAEALQPKKFWTTLAQLSNFLTCQEFPKNLLGPKNYICSLLDLHLIRLLMAEGELVSLVVVHWAANRRVLNLMPTTSRDTCTLGLVDGQWDERV